MRAINRLAWVLLLLVLPTRTSAQTVGNDASTTTPSSPAWGGGMAVLTAIVVLLVAIGLAVKLYDLKRKREDEALSLQSHISDAILLDRSLAALPITAVAHAARWRRSPIVIALSGSVPTPELRESIMRLVEREVSRRHPGARAEDRLMVDPLIAKGRPQG